MLLSAHSMAKKHSTTALTAEQKAAQDARFAQGHEYDYVIIGSGNSSLVVSSLLANKGYKVCILEAHDIPGGYVQSFKMGDFYFCGQVHYIWGCGPGGKIYEFLKRIGLEKDITFELMDPKGYDVMSMPDGKRVGIPYDFGNLVKNIEEAYPGQGAAVKKFTDKIMAVRKEFAHLPARTWTIKDYATTWYKVLNLIKYQNATVQDLFNECGVARESQDVLMAGAGDFMECAEKLSFFAFAGLFGGYNTGSYYPTKHFKYYVDRLVQFITDKPGCHIYYETLVTKIVTKDGKVQHIETKDGKVFKGKNYICNADPALAAKLIEGEDLPAEYKKKLEYEYSPSGLIIYLGLKDIDLTKFGFGSFNIWHQEQWDMNKTWKDLLGGDFSKPWVFLSTPTLHTDAPGTTPEGGSILEIETLVDYQEMKDLMDKSYVDYLKRKNEIAEKLLDIVEEKFIPNLRKHIAVKVVGTTTTNEDFVMAPRGNAYGAALYPKYLKKRLFGTTPFSNFFWCNATSGWGGVYGTTNTGMKLYSQLTGDNFYDDVTDEQLIAELPKNYPNQF